MIRTCSFSLATTLYHPNSINLNSVHVEVHFESWLIIILSTFLKRKGGLFKKAHELSVLCSVEVAVIIFGHNKKLYEYSSHDINETIGKFQYVRDPLLGVKERD